MSLWQRKLRRALGSVKDQTTIGLAKVASAMAPDLEVALVKATSHDEAPTEEKHVQDVLHFTTTSRAYAIACVSHLSRRLGRTHNWIVAIKALMLIHRLLREGDTAFEEELLCEARTGGQILNLSGFRDDSHSNSWDYSAFIRTYALFLDELLDYNLSERPPSPEGGRPSGSSSGRRSGYDAYGTLNEDYGSGCRHLAQNSTTTAVKDMKPHELLEKIPSVQRMLERVLACRPTGAARVNRLVQIALYPVVRESFQFYANVCDGLAIILDAYFEMEHADCVKAFEIQTMAAKQVDALDSFYSFCKNIGVSRSSEYPFVQKIPEELLETMEDFLRDCFKRASLDKQLKSPDSFPRSAEKEQLEAVGDGSYEVNGMEALPEPPLQETVSATTQDSILQEPQMELDLLDVTNATVSAGEPQMELDLLDVTNATVSAGEHGGRLALALFADTASSADKQWQAFDIGEAFQDSTSGKTFAEERSVAGWELTLLASPSNILNPSSYVITGGFDRLLVDSLYEQAINQQRLAVSVPSGSAALPGNPASSFLALPAPEAQAGEDPFAASLTIPPPPYVQMSDMKQKQELLVQEQQLWYQYQRDGMQGCNGLVKIYNNGFNSALQTVHSAPYFALPHK